MDSILSEVTGIDSDSFRRCLSCYDEFISLLPEDCAGRVCENQSAEFIRDVNDDASLLRDDFCPEFGALVDNIKRCYSIGMF